MPALRNLTTGEIIARNVRYGADLWSRMIGFLPRREISPNDGYWYPRCAAIHTIGMRTSIDVIFLDRDNRVLRVVASVPRHRIAVACAGARSVVELGDGVTTTRDVLEGDRLVLE